jgi:protein-disulfide isomerase-like protein with CxxC motif
MEKRHPPIHWVWNLLKLGCCMALWVTILVPAHFRDPAFGEGQQMKANSGRAFGGKEREHVRDDSPYFTDSSAHWRAPHLAT